MALALARQNGDVLSPAQENIFLTRWLTYALETAKDMHWNYRLLSDREWSGRYAVALSAGVNSIYLSRTNLDVAFDDCGQQVNPLTARLMGNVAGVLKLFKRCGWQAELDTSLPHQYSLMGVKGA